MRYTLAEIAKNVAPDGDWFALACELRRRARNTMDIYNVRQIGEWNFDTYVTDPEFLQIRDNCITFVERGSDTDVYKTDLPYAIADGSVTISEWLDTTLTEARERLKKQEEERQARLQERMTQSVNAEKETLRRLACKYPAVLREFISDEEEDES